VRIEPALLAEHCQVCEQDLSLDAAFNREDPRLYRQMVQLIGATDPQAPALRAVLDGMVVDLARTIGRLQGGVLPRVGDGRMNPAALRRVLEFIETRLAENPSVDEMAAEAGLGASAFLRAFRGSMGQPPGQYLLQRRLDRARELLQSTSLPIARIAAGTGFCNQAHLTRAFHDRFGTTPARAR
jgi:transcriptional regulator GlxA family with amidase domain